MYQKETLGWHTVYAQKSDITHLTLWSQNSLIYYCNWEKWTVHYICMCSCANGTINFTRQVIRNCISHIL